MPYPTGAMLTSYREGPLIPLEHVEHVDQYIEVNVPGGSPQPDVAGPSTLGGGYSFKYTLDDNILHARNRFIIWCVLLR